MAFATGLSSELMRQSYAPVEQKDYFATELPIEIILTIFSYLDPETIQNAACVNHSWNSLFIHAAKREKIAQFQCLAKLIIGELNPKIHRKCIMEITQISPAHIIVHSRTLKQVNSSHALLIGRIRKSLFRLGCDTISQLSRTCTAKEAPKPLTQMLTYVAVMWDISFAQASSEMFRDTTLDGAIVDLVVIKEYSKAFETALKISSVSIRDQGLRTIIHALLHEKKTSLARAVVRHIDKPTLPERFLLADYENQSLS